MAARVQKLRIDICQELKAIINAAQSPVYIVGGFVRDTLCGKTATEIDLAGAATADRLGLGKEFEITMVNKRLSTALIKFGNKSFEYTPFRSEEYNLGAHTPTKVELNVGIEADANRRDFCCNAIYYNPKTQEVIDFNYAIEDCRQQVLRQINDDVFTVDGLRLLRLVRLACETGFSIDDKTLESAAKNAHNLKDISPERIVVELKRILNSDQAGRGIRLLGELGLIKYFLPEVADMVGVKQPPRYHKYCVFEHSVRTVEYAPPHIRLAALLHDVGKPICVREQGNMHGHAEIGANCTQSILRDRLRLSCAETKRVCELIGLHMYDADGKTKESKVRRFVCQNFELIEDLCALIKADMRATGILTPPDIHRFERVKEQIIALNVPKNVGELEVDGYDAIKIGLTKNQIGQALYELWNRCVCNLEPNQRETLLLSLKKIKKNIKEKEE